MCANQFSRLSRAPSNLYDTITAILQENRECITKNVYPAPAECACTVPNIREIGLGRNPLRSCNSETFYIIEPLWGRRKPLQLWIHRKNKIRLKKCHPAFEDLITLGSPLHCIYWSWQKSYLPELQVELPVGITYTEHSQTTCGTTCRSHKKSYLSELPIRSIVKLPAELPAGAVWRATCRSCLITICRSSVTRFLNCCEGFPQMRHQRNILKS
jgi:hypothetical protein